MNATTLPILDLARYADPADKAAFLADLRHAARDIGFFYLINHGAAVAGRSVRQGNRGGQCSRPSRHAHPEWGQRL